MVKDYLSVEDAKAFLKLSKSTIYDYVHDRKIPHIKVGDRVMFDESDLVTWMNSKKRKSLMTENSTKQKPTLEQLKKLQCPEGYQNRIKHNVDFCTDILNNDDSDKSKKYVFNIIEKSKALLREAELKYPDTYFSFPITESVLEVYKEYRSTRKSIKDKPSK